jgi:integrase
MARTQGIRTRHSRTCNIGDGGRCNCTPSVEAFVYSKRDGKKIRKTFSGKGALSEAKGWRTDALKAVKDKKLRAPTSQTLGQAVEEWLELARQGAVLARTKEPYKPAVLREYERSLRLRVLPELGNRRLSDIDVGDLLALKERLLAAGHSGSTVRNTFVPLQAIYRRAVLSGSVPLNPTLGLDLPTGYQRRDRTATPEEAAELLAALPESERPLWATAFYGGLRRGELRALRAENIDLEAGLIRVEHGWDDKAGEIEPKSKRGRRTVPIPSVLRPYLVDHLTLTARRGQDFVFGSTALTPFTPKNVRRKALKAWETENKKRGERLERGERVKLLAPIVLHEARHTYVTLMFYAGLPLERIGDYVGHSSAYMTDRYRHLLEGHEKEAADLLDAFLARADTAARVAQVEAE